MGRDFRLQQLTGPGGALNMVGVGVRGDQHLARRQIEIHLPDQLDDFFHGVEIADVDQQKLAAAVDEIHVYSQPSPGLVVHFDDMGKEIFPLQHDSDPRRDAKR